MIEVLLEKGYAYVAGGNVYFDTSKLDDYYVFSSQSEKELLVGVRDDVEEDVNKKNKMILYSGLQSQNLRIRRLNGIAHGALDIRDGTLSAHASV